MPAIGNEYGRCTICPRNCGADRNAGPFGFCRSGNRPFISHYGPHRWEEPPISGTLGSGTVFFSGCNLRCSFCQNSEISRGDIGKEVDAPELAEIFLSLGGNCHNVNLVTAAHHLPFVVKALEMARSQGLKVPVVYNTSSYEKVDAIRRLDGLVDIYLPDFKYVSCELSSHLSGAPDYFEVASSSIAEMMAQVGHLEVGDGGIAGRGLLIRHLVLPGESSDSIKVLEWIRQNLGRFAYVSIMSQFTPDFLDEADCKHDRRINATEYSEVIEKAADLGLVNVFTQELSSADSSYVPEFNQL